MQYTRDNKTDIAGSHLSTGMIGDVDMQAYLDKTNQTMQAAAEQIQALKSQQAGEGGSDKSAGKKETKDDGLPLPADSGEAAGAPSGATGSFSAPHSDQQSSECRERSTAETSSASGGCPYIGFTASTNFMDAQTLWDASMAHSISAHILKAERGANAALLQRAARDEATGLQAIKLSEETSSATSSAVEAASSWDVSNVSRPLVLHVCGKFHSEGGFGISEHLHAYKEGLRLLVVTFVPTLNGVEVSRGEFLEDCLDKYGDYVILTDLSAPRSYAIEHPL